MREVAIGEVCELINGRAFKPSDWSTEGLPIVRIQNLNNEDAPFNRYSGEVRARFLIDSGALLFSWSGTPGTSFGAFFWHRGQAILNQHIFHVLPRNGIDKNYLRYALNGRIERIIAQAHGGVGLQHITKDKLEATTIPILPPVEQRRVADILDKADAIRRKRKEVIALTEELLRSAFLEMFGDPVANPKRWPVSVIEDLCSTIVDCPHTTPKYGGDDRPHPCVRTSDLQGGFFDWSTTRYVSAAEYRERIARLTPTAGDVFYTREGERFGIAAILPGGVSACLGQRMMLLRPDTMVATPQFLWALMNSSAVYRQATAEVGGTTSPHVNIKSIRRFRAVRPPLALQREYSRVYDTATLSRARCHAALKESATLFNSLVARAFSGGLTS